MTKKNFIILFGSIAAICVFLAIVFFSSNPTENEEPIRFRLKWLAYNSFASHYYAQENGIYEKHGVKVEILEGGPGISPIRLVASGQDDVGLASYDEILVAREQGIPVVAIAEDFKRSGVGLFSLPSNPVKTPQDLVGKKIAHRPGTDKDLLLRALLDKEGIPIESVELINGASFDSLLNGSIDVFPGFLTNQPQNAKAKGIDLVSVDPYDYGIRPGGNVYFTSENTLKEREQVIKKFLSASIEARNKAYLASSEDVISALLTNANNLEPDAEISGWEVSKQLLFEKPHSYIGLMNRETWSSTNAISEKFGIISNLQEIEAIYTNDLLARP